MTSATATAANARAPRWRSHDCLTEPRRRAARHEHSGYSDGWPGSRPADFYASGRAHGLDFMGGSDHSDNTALPNSFSDYYANPSNPDYDPAQPGCALADTINPLDSFRKWDATGEQAAAGTTSTFIAVRGFEWTSDRFGHINVYFSTNYANAKADGGYADLSAFYGWLTRPVVLGGGADGLATFNHPGDKKLSTTDPAYNWGDFAYVPSADAQMARTGTSCAPHEPARWWRTRALCGRRASPGQLRAGARGRSPARRAPAPPQSAPPALTGSPR